MTLIHWQLNKRVYWINVLRHMGWKMKTLFGNFWIFIFWVSLWLYNIACEGYLSISKGSKYIDSFWNMKFMKDYLFSWLTRDKEEMEEIRLAKMLEEEKAQFAVCFQFLFVWSKFVFHRYCHHCCKILTFSSYSPKPVGQFQPNLGWSSLDHPDA